MTISTDMTTNPDRVLQTQSRCVHPACTCRVEAGEQYCSEACRTAPSASTCGCNHPGCAHSGQMSTCERQTV